MLKELSRGVVILAVGLFIGAPQAAPTLVVDAGVLTGARNVVVNGTPYDVNFVDGTCAALFSGCDAASDFAFQSEAAAVAASQALLRFVFIDGPAGSFDSMTSTIRGCTGSGDFFCNADTPFELFDDVGVIRVRIAQADNIGVRIPLPDIVTVGEQHPSLVSTDILQQEVYAVWSMVPEPHAWSYLSIGGFVLALAMLRRRRSDDRTFKRLS
jgi:hypothetical protein